MKYKNTLLIAMIGNTKITLKNIISIVKQVSKDEKYNKEHDFNKILFFAL